MGLIHFVYEGTMMQTSSAVTSAFGQVQTVYTALTRVLAGSRRNHTRQTNKLEPKQRQPSPLPWSSDVVSPYLMCSAPDEPITVDGILNACSHILPEVLAMGACPMPVLKRRHHLFDIKLDDSLTLSWNARNEAFYIQRRGFRTHRTGSTPETTQSHSILGSIFEKARGKDPKLSDQRAGKIDASDTEIGRAVRVLAPYNFGRGKDSFRNKLNWIIPSLFLLYVAYVIIKSFIGSYVSFGGVDPLAAEDVDVTFADVQGVDEAKGELMEIVEYLRDPIKFCRLGARLPKGVLMIGPPGTGKTLLARAVAGEAEVPFFYACGSQFDEVLVGQGARRVRDLFAAAKKRAPAVIFIDEIDSVASRRGNSPLHGPYANQTINQLLTEMDGFQQNEGIIVIAATNRRQDLDRALLRPGRFDVEVGVAPPDLKGRRDIFKLYLNKVKQSTDIDIDSLAKGTIGFTGADIENMVNQAALRAAADGLDDVTMEYLEQAKDKIIMGPRKKTHVMDAEVTRMTAFHEAGHTLVAYYTKNAMPLHKVTVVPRGMSLGHTAMMPEKDNQQMTRAQMNANIDVMMGGRAAEELIFGTDKITTGVSDDLKRATAMAKAMVKTLGMSDKVGLRNFTMDDDNGGFGKGAEYAPSTAENIDNEINKILNDAYMRAKDILIKHAKEHKRLAEKLVEYETMNIEEIRACIEGNE